MEQLIIDEHEYLSPLDELDSPGSDFNDLIYFASGEVDRERIAFRKLGPNGWHRLKLFRDHYSGSWGMSGKKPFSPKSHDALVQFLCSMDFPKEKFPSVFLTDEGHLELIWENVKGEEIQVEFGSTESEYYNVEKQDGGTVENSELTFLPSTLGQ